MGENEITQQFLKEHFEYRDGHLWWVKPTARNVKVGQQFGCVNKYSYRAGMLKNKGYLEHRLIWLYHHGFWPKDDLDHINGVRDDNRISNLRECTQQQNVFNRKSYGKTSKFKGVSWHRQNNKWQASYGHKGKVYHMGYYETELEAAEAYREATKNLHKEFANYG